MPEIAIDDIEFTRYELASCNISKHGVELALVSEPFPNLTVQLKGVLSVNVRKLGEVAAYEWASASKSIAEAVDWNQRNQCQRIGTNGQQLSGNEGELVFFTDQNLPFFSVVFTSAVASEV